MLSLHAMFGTSIVQNGIHTSLDSDDALHDIRVMFPGVSMTRAGSMSLMQSRLGSRDNLGSKANSRNNLSSLRNSKTGPPTRGRVELERTLCIIKADAYVESPADEAHTEVSS
jgi:hypothetical protein